MLSTPQKPSQSFASAIERFSKDWQVQDVDYRYWCSLSCSLVTLEIQVDQAAAIQTMGLPK
jgi:hypothetical protein